MILPKKVTASEWQSQDLNLGLADLDSGPFFRGYEYFKLNTGAPHPTPEPVSPTEGLKLSDRIKKEKRIEPLLSYLTFFMSCEAKVTLLIKEGEKGAVGGSVAKWLQLNL